MYVIIASRKNDMKESHDYAYKDFQSFYELASVVTVSFFGKYSCSIETDDVNEIQEFILNSGAYTYLSVFIYTTEQVTQYLSLYYTNLPIIECKSQFELFKSIVMEKKLLIEIGLLSLLYASIGHKVYEMEDAVNKIVEEYGEQMEVSESMLASLFILNKTTYPKSLLVSYLKMDVYRKNKREKCLKDVGNSIALGAMIKNSKLFIKEKAKYFKTGRCDPLVKKLSTFNIAQMYRILVLERGGFGDVGLLLELYERGLSADDIVQRRDD